MYFMIQLLWDGTSVCYESSELRKRYLIPATGGCSLDRLPATHSLTPDYVRLCDCTNSIKNNIFHQLRIPMVVFVTNSDICTGQYQNNSDTHTFFFPSLNEKEFINYATILQLPQKHINDVISTCGVSKIRPLTTSIPQWIEYKNMLNITLNTVQIEEISKETHIIWHNSNRNISNLLCSRLKEDIIEVMNTDTNHDAQFLSSIYRFSNSIWSLCTPNMETTLCQRQDLYKYKNIRALYDTMYNKNMVECTGSLLIHTYQPITTTNILQSGIQYYKATDTEYNDEQVLCITKVVNKHLPIVRTIGNKGTIASILQQCQEPGVLYYFGSNSKKVDAFMYPNIFLQFSNTARRNREPTCPILLSTAMEYMQALEAGLFSHQEGEVQGERVNQQGGERVNQQGGERVSQHPERVNPQGERVSEVHYITLVPQSLQDTKVYSKAQPFVVDDQKVASEVEKLAAEAVEKHKQQWEIPLYTESNPPQQKQQVQGRTTIPHSKGVGPAVGSTVSFEKLPVLTKQRLERFKQHFGFVRAYSTWAPQLLPLSAACRVTPAVLTSTTSTTTNTTKISRWFHYVRTMMR